MATAQAGIVLRHIRDLVASENTGKLLDRQLLERFTTAHEQEAFATLIRHHGPLVLSVCRRVLGNWHDAEDAFQATFLILARKADSIHKQQSLGCWLYQVAYHAALKAKTQAVHRQQRERQAGSRPTTDPLAEVTGRELLSVLDEELQGLPEQYRTPLVLCYLQGKTCDEAARESGWSYRTFQRRLDQARQRLRGRLARRGLTLPGALLATGVTQCTATAAVPARLATATLETALATTWSATASVPVTSAAVTLAEAVCRALFTSKLKLAGVCVFLVGLLALGLGAFTRPSSVQGHARATVLALPAEGAKDKIKPVGQPVQPKKDEQLLVSGRVLAADGKPVPHAEVALVGWLRLVVEQSERLSSMTYDGRTDKTEVLAKGKTDKEGRFQLAIPRTTSRRFFTAAALAGAKGHGVGWQPIELKPARGDWEPPELDDPKLSVDVRLFPPQKLSGKLIDLQGQPIAGVKVGVVRIGTLTIPPDRQYYLYGDRPRDLQTWYGVFGEGGKNPPPAGQNRGIQFEQPPECLSFWPRSATTDAQGRFTLQGLPRNRAIGLQVLDGRFTPQVMAIEAKDKETVEEVAPALAPARLLYGTITDAETGKPVPHVRVCAHTFPNYLAGVGSSEDNADWRGRRFGFNFLISRATPIIRTEVQADAKGRYEIYPYPGHTVLVTVFPPKGTSYLLWRDSIGWAKGTLKKELEVKLTPGERLRGRVIDETGQGIAGARLDVWSKESKLRKEPLVGKGAQIDWELWTGADGSFETVLPRGRWHLLVNAPRAKYLCQKIPVTDLTDNPPARMEQHFPRIDPKDKPHFRPDAWTVVDLKKSGKVEEVTLKLRHLVLRGELVDPEGNAIAQAKMMYHIWPSGYYAAVKDVKNGKFELPVRDLEARYHLFFLDAAGKLGASVEVIGKQAEGKSIVVKLATCGSARVRLLDDKGKALGNYRPLLWTLLPPGPHKAPKDLNYLISDGLRCDDAVWAAHTNPMHYGDGPRTDAEGWVTLPALIPGATYRLSRFDGQVTDFTAASGKSLDLREVRIRPAGEKVKLPVVKAGK
jgi:RNA polymerase sigma factor (sigma-70 family)